MKSLQAALWIAVLLILAGCQSLSVVNYTFEGESTVVSTTFNELPPNSVGLKEGMLVDGTLHQEAKRREPVTWQVGEPMTRTSRISFRIKIGDTVDEDYPKATFYMLRRGNPDSFASIRFDDRSGTRYVWQTENASANEEISSRRFPEGKWFNVDIVLNQDEISLFIDGTRVGTGFMPSYLPENGFFRVETYNEIWLDDLRIVNFETAQTVAANTRDTTSVDVGIVFPDEQQWRRDGALIAKEIAPGGYVARERYAAADQALQNEQIRNLVRQGVHVLVVNSINSGVESAVAEAARNGVTVIAYNRFIPGSDAVEYFVTFDTAVVGEMQATVIAEALDLQDVFANDPKYIALFAGDPDNAATPVFFDTAMEILGFHIDRRALRVVGPGPKSSDSFQFDRITVPEGSASSAEFQTRNLLATDAADVTLDAVLAPTDAIAGGIITALGTDPRYTEASSYPIITGSGGAAEALQRVEAGFQYMTITRDTRRLASLAGLLAVRHLDGFHSPDLDGARIDTEIHTNGENRVIAYLLPPSLIRTDVRK